MEHKNKKLNDQTVAEEMKVSRSAVLDDFCFIEGSVTSFVFLSAPMTPTPALPCSGAPLEFVALRTQALRVTGDLKAE